MKKLYFLIVAIIGVIVFLQCQKSEDKIAVQNSDPSISVRSSSQINKVISPSCNIWSFIGGIIYCKPDSTVQYVFTTDLGCDVEVTMEVKHCNQFNNNNQIIGRYVDFRNLRWRLLYPTSEACLSWYRQLVLVSINGNSTDFKNFSFMLQQKFEEKYMLEYFIENDLSCENDPVVNTLFFKSPCLQMCYEEINKEYNLYLTPCASDGCCVNETVYCYDDEEEELVTYQNNTYSIAPCTNYYPDPCQNDNSAGLCQNSGCQ